MSYNAGCGCVVFLSADGPKDTRTTVFPLLAAQGWLAAAVVNPTTIGRSNKLTVTDCRFLDGQGWDVGSHGWTHVDPTLLAPEELDAHLRYSHRWLVDRGLDRGARHYGPPLDCNEAVRDAALAFYETVIPAQIGPWAVLPEGWTYAWLPAQDTVPWAIVETALGSLVANAGAVTVLPLHHVVLSEPFGLAMSVVRLRQIIRYIRLHAINVVTVSQLRDGEIPA